MSAIPKLPNSGDREGQGGSDPLLEEIRFAKQSLLHQFGNDVRKLGEHLMQQQEANRNRLVTRPEKNS
ncbi:MAG TPA: hypothetical protein VGG19_19515 [Tepidisphaeraceae bacterium]|jgi:hypothetical protein